MRAVVDAHNFYEVTSFSLTMERPTDDLEQKPPAKKPRLEQKQPPLKSGDNDGNANNDNDNDSNPFMALKDGPFHHVLGFLDWRDLNEFAQVSKKCQKARNHPGLDQTREATIRFLSSQEIDPYDPFSRREFSVEEIEGILRHIKEQLSIYSGNYTRLVIKGLENLGSPTGKYDDDDEDEENWTWDDISSFEATDHGKDAFYHLEIFVRRFPKLHEINVSGIEVYDDEGFGFWNDLPARVLRFENAKCKDASSLRFGQPSYHFSGMALNDCRNLQELYLDGTVFECFQQKSFLGDIPDRLQKVSCIGVKVDNVSEESCPKPLDQEQLMKFVRTRRSLCWLRSDLTQSNVAILKRERPDVAFVSPTKPPTPTEPNLNTIVDLDAKLQQVLNCIESFGSKYSESAQSVTEARYFLKMVYREQQHEELRKRTPRELTGEELQGLAMGDFICPRPNHNARGPGSDW